MGSGRPTEGGAVNRTTAIATGAWIVVIAAGVGALVIRALYPFPLVANTFGLGPASIVAGAVLGFTWATVGALLVARRPENVVGRYWLSVLLPLPTRYCT